MPDAVPLITLLHIACIKSLNLCNHQNQRHCMEEIKLPAEGRLAAKRQSWDMNPGSLAPKYMPSTTVLHSWRDHKTPSTLGSKGAYVPGL